MRILIVHFSHFLLSSGSGVTEKTLSIARALRRGGADVQVVNFSPKEAQQASQEVTYIHYDVHQKWEVIHRWFESNTAPEDIIWMRYPFADKYFLMLTQRWGKQMVLEHNTIETQEVLLLQKKSFRSLSFQWRKSYFIYFLQTFILKNTNETRYGHLILKNVLGGICVTHEIAQFEKRRYSDYRTFVLPNGVDKVNTEVDARISSNNPISKHQKWVMVIGSLADWHGLDRLLKSIVRSNALRLKSIQIDIMGLDSEQAKGYHGYQKNGISLQCCGKFNPKELESKLPEYDLAIGSLALYKIGIKEACPLKVREYWKAGIPVLLAYQDTACLENPELNGYNYTIPNNGSSIQLHAVFEWVVKCFSNRANHLSLKKAAQVAIEYEKKAAEMLAFLSNLQK